MICSNCGMEIVGVTGFNLEGCPICYECCLSSLCSTDGTIACPRCLGLGKITAHFNWNDGRCDVCKSAGRIKAAEVEMIALPVENEPVLFERVETEDCPF